MTDQNQSPPAPKSNKFGKKQKEKLLGKLESKSAKIAELKGELSAMRRSTWEKPAEEAVVAPAVPAVAAAPLPPAPPTRLAEYRVLKAKGGFEASLFAMDHSLAIAGDLDRERNDGAA